MIPSPSFLHTTRAACVPHHLQWVSSTYNARFLQSRAQWVPCKRLTGRTGIPRQKLSHSGLIQPHRRNTATTAALALDQTSYRGGDCYKGILNYVLPRPESIWRNAMKIFPGWGERERVLVIADDDKEDNDDDDDDNDEEEKEEHHHARRRC